jgi:hypothetical protein
MPSVFTSPDFNCPLSFNMREWEFILIVFPLRSNFYNFIAVFGMVFIYAYISRKNGK